MDPPVSRATLSNHLHRVREQIASAAIAAGRDPSSITLIGVTKYVDIETTRILVELGCRILGESRPQELWRKAAQIGIADVHWHLVGHLQRNKIRRTLPIVDCIHSVDSLALIDGMQEIAAELHICPTILLEVNISGESAKHGFSPESLPEAIERLGQMSHLRCRGLMGMSGLTVDRTGAQSQFASLRTLRDRLSRMAPPNLTLDELSMGMSDDFDLAIREGATMVRIGSALFSPE